MVVVVCHRPAAIAAVPTATTAMSAATRDAGSSPRKADRWHAPGTTKATTEQHSDPTSSSSRAKESAAVTSSDVAKIAAILHKTPR